MSDLTDISRSHKKSPKKNLFPVDCRHATTRASRGSREIQPLDLIHWHALSSPCEQSSCFDVTKPSLKLETVLSMCVSDSQMSPEYPRAFANVTQSSYIESVFSIVIWLGEWLLPI